MFNNLNAEMGRRNLTMKALSNLSGIGYESLKNKMSGNTEFKRNEMISIKRQFPQCSMDYLFATDEASEEGR